MWRDTVHLPQGVVAFRYRRNSIGATHAGEVVSKTPALSLAEMKALQQRAFDRGREVGQTDAATRLGALLVAIERSATGLAEDRAKERQSLAQFGVELGVGIAGELVGSALATNTHDVRHLVDLALETALPSAAGAPVTLRMNPDDLIRLEAGMATHPLGSGLPVQLLGDAALSRGSVKVFSGGAEVDADLRKRLDAMSLALKAKADPNRA